MIPKIIHRVWMSEDLPDPNTDLGKCFYSQEKLKDYGYEIKTYNSHNFDFSISNFLAQAYALKQWAFVTDYIRFWVIYNYGGIYLDADVEINKTFDPLLESKYFFGATYPKWKYGNKDQGKNCPNMCGLYFPYDYLIDPAVFGAEKENYIVGLFLNYLNNRNFIEYDGYIHNQHEQDTDDLSFKLDILDLKVCRVLNMYGYNKYGFIEDINEYINSVNQSDIYKDVYILNTEFLTDPFYKDHNNENCICSHKHIGSWINRKNKRKRYLSEYSEEEQEEYRKRLNYILNKV